MASFFGRPDPFAPEGSRGTNTTQTTSISDLPQAQIDAIIRTKRKAREPKACYPCHTRKVKCDRNLPCDGCVKRDHADLCSYERPSKKRQANTAFQPTATNDEVPEMSIPSVESSSVQVKSETVDSVPADFDSSGRISVPREHWNNVCNKLKEMEQAMSTLRSGLEQIDAGRSSITMAPDSAQSADANNSSPGTSPEREGIHTTHTYGEGTVHLGSRSVLAYILNKSGSLQAQALLEGGILPKLGLDNETATYPFVDLWSSDTSAFDVNAVCNALPTDQQILEFFHYYRDIAGTLYPVLVDVPGFEANLHTFLRNRSAAGGVFKQGEDRGLSQRPFGMSLAFVGSLFAVLASGCQSSDLPGKERELTSQVYVCCAYQCLRMCNFVSQPTLEAMKTLLIIGNVLSYNMNPGVSYVLLGMTMRMGLALGLHVESNRFDPVERYTRQHIWWSMAWQDSHFSLSYDRPSTVAVSQPDIADRPESMPGNRDYFETMCRIISLTLEVVRGRMVTPHFRMSFKSIQTYKDRIQQFLAEASPHLRDRQYCRTSMDHLQRLALRVHSSYITSELCRPALKPEADKEDPLLPVVRRYCVENLISTVESYIELHSFSAHGSRAWITLQRAISCAFLLAVIDEGRTEPKVKELLHELEVIISERATAEGGFDSAASAVPAGTISDSYQGAQPASIPANISMDTQTQWAKPLVRSLRALQKLNIAFDSYNNQPGSSHTASLGSADALSAQQSMGYRRTSSVNPQPQSAYTPNMGSLPPPTPESSSSGDWTFPNLLDRAAEYIHPPLWG
ncbi:C6 transcription factor, putative [Talaromyces stipitatus ATCC 10500]|uniref:C6 transcription factor, putative n=1 Tax=Talaromyces stipitatus (strain ATCC 10500 / CBS 375.48 / QM 6759 / NRRL 1006) TaxID=441959 RepID=B8MAR5_TALSN|nr:C6 transcription factor, putative [Talaromyces stipitatus ATCC 10500]EED17755.1 C6 transcription factor, putative [Talaromyces stipitatus ATCC 10500]